MAVLREIGEDVVRQALVNKTLNADQVAQAARGDPVEAETRDLELIAADIATPELLPYEYAYTDIYTDGDGRFFLAIKDRFYRRSVAKRLSPA